MMKNWWKILSVVILTYVLIVGLLAPLNPGISHSKPNRKEAGDMVVLTIEGYNTHFADNEDVPRVWLRLDEDHAIQAQQVMSKNDQELRASFYIPSVFPNDEKINNLSLIIDSKKDGFFAKPSALSIRLTDQQNNADLSLWNKTPIVNLTTRTSFGYPFRNILEETIRNVYFHVPMWFGMILLFASSVWYSFKYIRTSNLDYDHRATSLVNTGILFGILGLVTGMLWAKYTWGQFWSWDIKQNMSAITVLIYCAMLVLRSSFDDEQRRARLGAGYNIFAFILMIPLLFVIPRMADSLHPGNGGNPALGSDDMDNTMRMVFYPAVIGWTLLGFWISNLHYRYFRLQERQYN